ncbi:MAG: hypothetical protein E6K27_06270, partial [Gammaproteobacteria bacterium]
MRTLRASASLLIALLSMTALAAAAPSAEPTPGTPPAPTAQRARWIVQASSVAAARRSVADVGATVDRELDIINGVSAYLNPRQSERLRARAGVRLYEDRAVQTRCLLGSVVSTTNTLVSPTNNTLATSPVGTV